MQRFAKNDRQQDELGVDDLERGDSSGTWSSNLTRVQSRGSPWVFNCLRTYYMAAYHKTSPTWNYNVRIAWAWKEDKLYLLPGLLGPAFDDLDCRLMSRLCDRKFLELFSHLPSRNCSGEMSVLVQCLHVTSPKVGCRKASTSRSR